MQVLDALYIGYYIVCVHRLLSCSHEKNFVILYQAATCKSLQNVPNRFRCEVNGGGTTIVTELGVGDTPRECSRKCEEAILKSGSLNGCCVYSAKVCSDAYLCYSRCYPWDKNWGKHICKDYKYRRCAYYDNSQAVKVLDNAFYIQVVADKTVEMTYKNIERAVTCDIQQTGNYL